MPRAISQLHLTDGITGICSISQRRKLGARLLVQVPEAAGLQENAQPSVVEDLRNAIDFLRRRAPVWLGSVVVAIALAFLYLAVTPPKYAASVSLLIAPSATSKTPSASVLSDSNVSSPIIDTQVALLRSEAVARRVASELRLDLDPEFNGALKSPIPLDPKTHPGPALQPAWVVGAALSGLDVRRDGTTSLISLSYRANSPERAAQLANAFAKQYVALQLESRFRSSQEASAWLEEKLAVLRSEVDRREREVAQFRAANGLFSVSGSTMAEAQLSQLTEQLSSARADLAERQSRLQSAKSQEERGLPSDSLGEVLSSPLISSLRAQQAQVLRTRGELATTLGPLHPRMAQNSQELLQIENQINQEIRRIISSLESEVEASRRRVESLQQSLQQWEQRLGADGSSMVQLQELERRATAARSLYESFLEQFNATSTAARTAATDIQVLANAEPVPWPAWPNRTLVLMMASAAGLIVGLGVVILLEAIRGGFHQSEEVERALMAPVVGMVQRVKVPGRSPSLLASSRQLLESSVGGDAAKSISSEEKRDRSRAIQLSALEDAVINDPRSSFAESLRALRAVIMSMRWKNECPILLMTSATPGDGKTLTSISFARSLATSGYKVLVIDADHRRPDLTGRMAPRSAFGLLEVLKGEIHFDEAILQDERSPAMVLPCLPGGDWYTRDFFSGAEFQRVLDKARSRFDFVIIDAAPAAAVADSLILSRVADGVLLAVRWGKTPRAAVVNATVQLRRIGANVVGILLTQVPQSSMQSYGYGYY